ncbi:MAG: chemotaxis protein [Rhizobium sp. 63-7]|nr:MAG: chemotaxis protein [Rhizobium sp. 63-7]
MIGITGSKMKAQVAALATLKANVMIADSKLNIVYMNDAVRKLLTAAEQDLKKELPRFAVDKLIGSNIDIFHKQPSHQRNLLARLTKPYSATIRVGSHSFDLHVVPIMEGTKITGFAVEWGDAKARLLNLDYQNQIAAIGRVQAIIEFTPDGHVVGANENFCKAMGYRLDEIIGKHHNLFVDRAYATGPAYAEFWKDLLGGQFQVGEFDRVGKNGRQVVLNASYNPIMDEHGKVAKIVTFATDVTERVHAVTTIGSSLSDLADGKLDFRLETPFAKDFESLRHTFNEAIEKLGSALGSVSETTGRIDNGTREIAAGANDLSKRTEQQAASLEETAAALDEITANVNNSTKRTEEARSVASQANHSATRSAEVVSHAEEAMRKIEESSQQISNIIGVIDEIAFQTNLLALNAGVEAARAGEAGKGFAVVAQEVRELAQRSAQAAKEIKGLIQNSTTEVESGVRLVRDAGEALKTIGKFIVEINAHMEAIATSAKEQATGLAEVNVAVNSMDQTTQQNAAMVEQSNAASNALQEEAVRLRELVGQFALLATSSSQVAALRQSARAMARPSRSVAAPSAPRRAAAAGGAASASDSWEEF